MFEKILSYLSSGAPLRLSVIAKDLSLTQPMLQQMLLDLLRMGYLEERALVAAPSCSSGCGSCSGCGTVSATPSHEGTRYHLTEKGLRKIKKI